MEHTGRAGPHRIAIAAAIAGFAARRTIGPTAAAAALGLAAAAAALRVVPDTRGDLVDAAAGWLRLPTLITTATAVAAVLDAWPAFGRDRADANWVRRLRLAPLDGAGIAAATTLAVLVGWLVAVGAVFELAVRPGAGRAVGAAVALEPVGPPRATPATPRIELRATRRVAADAVELRPITGLTAAGTVPSPRVRLHVDGVDLGVRTLPPGGGLLRAALDGRPLRDVALTLEPGQAVVLWLPAGAARAFAPTGIPAVWNGACAAATAALAAAVALALALAGRRHLEPAVLQVGALTVVVVGCAADWSPVPHAVHAYVRDLWCGDAATTGRAVAVATTAAAVAALASVAGWRGGRAADPSPNAARAPSRRPG